MVLVHGNLDGAYGPISDVFISKNSYQRSWYIELINTEKFKNLGNNYYDTRIIVDSDLELFEKICELECSGCVIPGFVKQKVLELVNKVKPWSEVMGELNDI